MNYRHVLEIFIDMRIEVVNTYNIEKVRKLRVREDQKDFIETIEDCLYEVEISSYGISWKPLAICYNDTIIGFSMYGKSKTEDIWLDRFMIDYKYQGKGLGKKSFKMIVERIIDEFKCESIYLSVNKSNDSAIKLYKKCGFKFIDELDGKDPVMELRVS